MGYAQGSECRLGKVIKDWSLGQQSTVKRRLEKRGSLAKAIENKQPVM